MTPDQVAKAEEISEMDAGHIVDNGEQKSPDEVTPQMMWKKLKFIQSKLMEMDGRLKKIEDDVKSPGGSQPAEKFTVNDLYEGEKQPGAAPSELGEELLGSLNENGSLELSDFEHLMKKHGKHATRKTYRNWMQKIADKHGSIEFKKGSRGGRNKPSRLEKDYSDYE